MKIVTVIGARPQFIKAGNISREIAKYNEIQEIIVHTGQHYDNNMSDIFFDEMKIPKPDYYLGINAKTHGAMTGQMMEKIEEIIIKENPDWVLVYGDTNSTLAGALVSSKLHIKLAHIEAGLRSFNNKMPEEINRILTDRVSSILFCPTNVAVKNLENEGFNNFNCKIVKSGDVMKDGVEFYKNLAQKPKFKIDKDYILVTIHRAENTDNLDRLKSIIEALNEINIDKQVILPLHPRTKKILNKNNIKINFTVIEPIGYLQMVWLIKNCDLVMTDSGGLQKEAYMFGKSCITLRDETEWIELIDNGYNILVGADKNKILNTYKNNQLFEFKQQNLYGDGNASKIIIKYLLECK